MQAAFYRFTVSCVLAGCLLCHTKLLNAQTEKGKLLAGGSVDISEAIQNTTSTFNFAIQPSFGAFLFNNFAMGGVYSFVVGSTKVLNSNGTHTATTTFNTLVGPYVKYYFGKKTMKPFISANGGYSVYTRLKSSTTTDGGSNSSITNYDGFAVGGSAGIAYFLNPHISLESALYLTASGYKTQYPTTRFGFSLGLYALLDKKKQE